MKTILLLVFVLLGGVGVACARTGSITFIGAVVTQTCADTQCPNAHYTQQKQVVVSEGESPRSRDTVATVRPAGTQATPTLVIITRTYS